MERMHHYSGFMSIHCSKYGKDASLLGLHVIHSSKCGKDASLLGLHVHTSCKYGKEASQLGFMSIPPVSLESMHYYWGFMSVLSSKYGKDASLLWLHVHTLQQ